MTTETEQAQLYLDGQERQRAARKDYDTAVAMAKEGQALIDKGGAMYIAGTKMLVDAYSLEDQLTNDMALTHYDAQAVANRMRHMRQEGRAMRNAANKETRRGKVMLRASNVARDKAAGELRMAGTAMRVGSGAPRARKPDLGFGELL